MAIVVPDSLVAESMDSMSFQVYVWQEILWVDGNIYKVLFVNETIDQSRLPGYENSTLLEITWDIQLKNTTTNQVQFMSLKSAIRFLDWESLSDVRESVMKWIEEKAMNALSWIGI